MADGMPSADELVKQLAEVNRLVAEKEERRKRKEAAKVAAKTAEEAQKNAAREAELLRVRELQKQLKEAKKLLEQKSDSSSEYTYSVTEQTVQKTPVQDLQKPRRLLPEEQTPRLSPSKGTGVRAAAAPASGKGRPRNIPRRIPCWLSFDRNSTRENRATAIRKIEGGPNDNTQFLSEGTWGNEVGVGELQEASKKESSRTVPRGSKGEKGAEAKVRR